jgi:hypothetical protein
MDREKLRFVNVYAAPVEERRLLLGAMRGAGNLRRCEPKRAPREPSIRLPSEPRTLSIGGR